MPIYSDQIAWDDNLFHLVDAESGREILKIDREGKLTIGEGLSQDEALIGFFKAVMPYLRSDVNEFVNMRLLLVEIFSLFNDPSCSEEEPSEDFTRRFNNLKHRLDAYFDNE